MRPAHFSKTVPASIALVLACLHASSTAQAVATARPVAAPAANPGQRAQLVAIRSAVVSSELSGKIGNVAFREGQAFRQGDTLVSYDCSLNRAKLERASQAEQAARKKLDVADQLDKLGSISKSDVDQARAAVAVAQAETSVERVLVRRCGIPAPFAGRVGETYVRASESVAEGKPLMSIYDDSAFELETIVPSRWLAWLKPGYPMRITVDETGRSYTATVARIAGTVDPVSQSVKVVGRLANEKTARTSHAAVLLPGMSGSVQIDPPASAP